MLVQAPGQDDAGQRHLLDVASATSPPTAR